MKKFLAFFLIAIMMFTLLLSGCGTSEADREDELKDSLESTYDELTATFSGETGQYDLVSEYLQSWASKNGIEVAAREENYMVLKNPATEGCKDVESTVLQCSVDTKAFANSLQSLSISLTCLLGPLEHGDISLLITENDNGEYTGAAAADPKYYQCDNFINMKHNDDVQLFTSGSYTASAVMSTDISTDAPQYSHAYCITMKTSGHHDPFAIDSPTYPNPVEVLGNLLATEKSSGQLFELASFECEASNGYIPTSATAIVVVDSNDVSSFEKKFRSSYNNMKKRFEKLEDNFVYTFTETSMPSSVMSSECSDNIISLMYTIKTGSFLQDEESGERIALSEMSSVSTTGGKFNLTMTYRSTDKSVIDEMSEVYFTTAGLCNIDYSKSDTRITWPSADNSELAAYFSDALGAKDCVFETTLESSECDIFAADSALNMISYRCNIHHGEAALANICHFLESLTE